MQAGRVDIPTSCVVCGANLITDIARTCGKACDHRRKLLADLFEKVRKQMGGLRVEGPRAWWPLSQRRLQAQIERDDEHGAEALHAWIFIEGYALAQWRTAARLWDDMQLAEVRV